MCLCYSRITQKNKTKIINEHEFYSNSAPIGYELRTVDYKQKPYINDNEGKQGLKSISHRSVSRFFTIFTKTKGDFVKQNMKM